MKTPKKGMATHGISAQGPSGLRDMEREEILTILDTAVQMKRFLLEGQKKTPHLAGKSVITLFYENSTRTRVSFEMASKYLSAASVNVSAQASSVTKGETLLDTGRTLDRMRVDIIVMRHPMAGAPHLLARHVQAGVINAGDGMNEHPTQALLDMFTMREKLGQLEGLRVAIVGDVLHSRVARSNLWGLRTMGASVVLAGPPTLMPPDMERWGARTTTRVDDAVKDADVVMGLRVQKERQQAGLFPSIREYHREFGLDERRLALARPGALVMHPGPVNRGVELTSSLIDGEMSVIDEQVTNGLAVRMALLFLMTRRGRE